MAAGRKTERVTLQSPTRTSDGQGGWTTAWSAVGSAVWAEVQTSAGSERWVAGQVMAPVARVVTVWYSAALSVASPTWRIVWGSRVLQIQAVEDVQERHQELRFHCLEVQGAPA